MYVRVYFKMHVIEKTKKKEQEQNIPDSKIAQFKNFAISLPTFTARWWCYCIYFSRGMCLKELSADYALFFNVALTLSLGI